MVWSMGWTSSAKVPPGLANAMPKGRWPSFLMRVYSAERSRLAVGESLKNTRPVYHCWAICPSQSVLVELAELVQLQGGALFQLASGGRGLGRMKTLPPNSL